MPDVKFISSEFSWRRVSTVMVFVLIVMGLAFWSWWKLVQEPQVDYARQNRIRLEIIEKIVRAKYCAGGAPYVTEALKDFCGK